MIYYYGDHEEIGDVEEITLTVAKATESEHAGESSFQFAVSLGSNCISASLLKEFDLRKFALPFDYVRSSGPMIAHCLQDGFKAFVDPAQIVQTAGTSGTSGTSGKLF